MSQKRKPLSVRAVMRKSVALGGAMAALVCSTHVAHADPAGWVGGMFGLSVPNAEDTTSRPIYGITGGAKVGTEFGIGAYYLNSNKNETQAGTDVAFNFDLYGIELAYHFEGEANGVFIGGRIGTSKMKAGSLTTSPMHYGLVGGYNHMLGSNFSIGADLSWVSVAESSGTPSGGPISQRIDTFNMLNFMTTAKLWF